MRHIKNRIIPIMVFIIVFSFVLPFSLPDISGMFGVVANAETIDEYDVSKSTVDITVVADKNEVKVNDTVKVAVKITANYPIAGLQIPVIYEKNVFQLEDLDENLTFDEESSIVNGSYRLGYNSGLDKGFRFTSDPNFWNTDDTKSRFDYVFFTAAYDSSINPFANMLAMPENEVFVTFSLKAKTDVKNATDFVFVSLDWVKTSVNKFGVFYVSMCKSDFYDSSKIVLTGMNYSTESVYVPLFLKPLRGTASIKSYKGEEYVAITMTPGKTATGIYTEMTDGGTVEITGVQGTVQALGDRYVAYQSQNKTNPVATMKVTYADGTVETYPVVFELYDMEREIPFNATEKIKPIRGSVSMGEDAKGEYILIEMLEGQSSVGVYKASLDGTTATLDGAEGMFTEQEKLYIFYGSQNTINPEGRLTVTESDGSTKTYRIVFKMYEMDPYVNAAKGLRPVRGAVTFDKDGTIRIKMTKGQKSVGLYKTMANGATFKIIDANGRVTNNPSSVMFYMTNNVANITATIVFTLPDGTTKEQKIIFDMGLASDPDPLTYLTAVRGTVSYQNDGTEDYIEVKANALSTGVGLNKDCLVKYTITDVDGVMTENDSRYYIYKSQNPNGVTANINFLQSDGSYKTYKVKFVF